MCRDCDCKVQEEREFALTVFEGRVETGNGVAGGYLEEILGLIGERIGLPPVFRGTFNVRIAEEYIVPADAQIEPYEYNQIEVLKLKRCRVVSGRRSVRCCIMRPNLHETCTDAGQLHDALTRLEVMSDQKLRSALDLKDGDTVRVELDGGSEWWLAPEDV